MLCPCETSGCKMTGLGIYCMYTTTLQHTPCTHTQNTTHFDSKDMTTSQVVETSVTVNNSPIQDYDYPDDHAPPTYLE